MLLRLESDDPRPLHEQVAAALRRAIADGSAPERLPTARDLADTPIVVWAPERKSFYTDFLISYCRRAGFEPTLVVNQIQGTPPFTAVRRYPEACAFVTDVPGDLQGGTVRVLAFDEPPLAPVQAMWLPHTHSAVRDAIVSGGGG